MTDTLHRVGNDVFLRGFLVATLHEDVPATIRDEVDQMIDAAALGGVDPDEHEVAVKEAYDEGYIDAENELKKDHEAALAEARDDAYDKGYAAAMEEVERRAKEDAL